MSLTQSHRVGIAAGVVAVYIALGWSLRLDQNSYLLIGIPLLLVFQLGIARRPLTELWLRRFSGRFITWKTLILALPFLICPGWTLVTGWKMDSWPFRLWDLAAVAGTIPLAATLARATKRTWLELLGCLLSAGIFGAGLMILTALRHHHSPHHPWETGAQSFLLYLPISFIIEEVFFRGGIDSYVQRDGERNGWLTAIIVSCLWGWWHLPILGIKNGVELLGLAIFLPVLLCLTGVPFSLFWRRSGSLFVTATVHSFVDAVRNGLM